MNAHLEFLSLSLMGIFFIYTNEVGFIC